MFNVNNIMYSNVNHTYTMLMLYYIVMVILYVLKKTKEKINAKSNAVGVRGIINYSL